MSAVNHPSGNSLHEQSSAISYGSVFGFLTGVLLLLAFCFLPWLTTQVDCPGGGCDGAARLQPMNPTGLALAAGSVMTHGVVARVDILSESDYQDHMVSLDIPPLPESQVSLPFLWTFPIVSLVMMLLSLTNLLRRGSRGPQGNVKNRLLVGTLFMAVLVELFSMGSLSSALAGTADALAQMNIQVPDGSTNTLTLSLSTFPDFGFWFALVMTLMGGEFILWAWWEEKPGNIMYSLGHLESVAWSSLSRTIRQNYRLYPLNITRPRRGTSRTPLVCPVCHESFTLRVRSKPTLWLYRSLLTAGLIAVLMPGILVLGRIGILFVFPLFFCLLLCLFFLMVLDGVSLGRFFNRSHLLSRGKLTKFLWGGRTRTSSGP